MDISSFRRSTKHEAQCRSLYKEYRVQFYEETGLGIDHIFHMAFIATRHLRDKSYPITEKTQSYQPSPTSMEQPTDSSLHLFRLVEDVGEVALSAVLTVVHGSHEDTSTALSPN